MAPPTKFEDAFERNPKICGGQPVFRGTRVLLRSVLPSLAEGDSFEDVMKAFPTLTPEHLRAAVAFAASSAQEDLPVPGAPEPSRSRLCARVLSVFRSEAVETWHRCLVVVSDRKVRVRRTAT